MGSTPIRKCRIFAISQFAPATIFPEDVAYLIAKILVETRHRLEGMFAHIPSNRSALTYPIEPARIPETQIPLHPGAERYYREAGLIAG